MSDETISTVTAELPHGTYDDNPNVTKSIGESEAAQSQAAPQDDMPWLLRDKFKGDSIEDVMKQQAMAYDELQKKMGKFWGAPKESDYDVSGLNEYGIEAQDPILQGMMPAFKEMGLSNEAVKKLAASYDDSLKSMARGMEENLQKAMTPDMVQAAQRVEGWMKKFATPDQAKTMQQWLQTPEDFKTFNNLLAHMPTAQTNNVPSQNTNYGHLYETSAQVEREKIENFAKYNKDAGYISEVARRYRDAKIRESRS